MSNIEIVPEVPLRVSPSHWLLFADTTGLQFYCGESMDRESMEAIADHIDHLPIEYFGATINKNLVSCKTCILLAYSEIL